MGASVLLADGAGALLTGRLSLSSHKWLSGHVVFGTTILPGSAFVELALTAAQRVGLDTVEELTLEAPLVLPERGSLQLQLSVGPLDAAGTRTLTLHARRDDGAAEGAWTRHASATLRSRQRVASACAERGAKRCRAGRPRARWRSSWMGCTRASCLPG